MPTTVSLRSLLVPRSLLLRLHCLCSRSRGSGRVHTKSAATRARVSCRTSASAVCSFTGWRRALCSRSAQPIVLQKARATGSDIVAVARGCHTLPRRQLVVPALWLPSWLLICLRRNPQPRRLRAAAHRCIFLCQCNRRAARIGGAPGSLLLGKRPRQGCRSLSSPRGH